MKFRIINRIDDQFLKKINFKIVKKLFFLISLLYFCVYFFNNYDQISFEINFQDSFKRLFLSFLFCVLSTFFNAFAWKNIVIWFGEIGIKNNLVSYYVLTNVLKYVPGGFWHFVERFNFLKDKSNPQQAFYSILIEPYFMLSTSFLLASIGIIFSPLYFLLIIPIFFLNRNLICFVLEILEFLKGKTANVLKLSKFKYQSANKIELTSFFPLRAIIFEIGFIFSKFISFLLCFKILSSSFEIDIIFLFIIFCLSWSIGLIVPAAPSGIGVFESCFLFFVGQNIPHNLIFVSLIYFRLISTSADLLLSLPFLMKKILKRI